MGHSNTGIACTALSLSQGDEGEACGPCRLFRDIAGVQGSKSQDKKIALITKLLVSSRDLEPGYIMRALQVPTSQEITSPRELPSPQSCLNRQYSQC